MPSLYEITIPVFISNLRILSSLLAKGAAHAPTAAAEQTLLTTRLIDDMAALPFQVQRVANTARNTAERLAGIEAITVEDIEVTFEDLQKRVEATIKILEGVTEDMFVKDDTEIKLRTAPGVYQTYTATSAVLTYGLPNFYFHFVTAYNLLRHQGVPIDKADYLGRV